MVGEKNQSQIPSYKIVRKKIIRFHLLKIQQTYSYSLESSHKKNIYLNMIKTIKKYFDKQYH